MNPVNPKRSEAISPARRAAFDILHQVAEQQAYASVRVAALSESDLSREDRALAQEIILGVLRWQRALDHFLERYSERSIDRLDLRVLIALRMGLYQLRYLDRVPQSAAVNESVNLVKRARVTSAAGLVNAVLRKAARNSADLVSQSISDPLEQASIELSHPKWMLERWRATLGENDTKQLALANNTPPTTAFRVNPLRATVQQVLADLEREGVITRESRIAQGGFVVESGHGSPVARAAQQGLIYIQDEASQLVSRLLEPKSGERVLDLCAAPGSKSSHIAALAGDKAWVLACDRHHHRLTTLLATCSRLGVRSIETIVLDAASALPLVFVGGEFDRVLVDAPCSGTGTLRGNPEIKWRLLAGDLPRLAELQLRLLEQGASAVATGGRLVYSTCSIEAEENEEVINRFLERVTAFKVIEPKAPPLLITGDRYVRTFPHRDGTDGFFAAVLERVC